MKQLSAVVGVGVIVCFMVAIMALPVIGSGTTPKDLFQEKCSKCHGWQKAFDKTKTAEEWTATVNKMQAKATYWISDDEAKIITKYLIDERGK